MIATLEKKYSRLSLQKATILLIIISSETKVNEVHVYFQAFV